MKEQFSQNYKTSFRRKELHMCPVKIVQCLGTRPSIIASVIVDSILSEGLALVPLRHSKDDLRRLKEIRHLSQPIMAPYESCCFSASKFARRLNMTVASGAIPPLTVKTRGVNDPCSISRTLRPYSDFFFLSCSR